MSRLVPRILAVTLALVAVTILVVPQSLAAARWLRLGKGDLGTGASTVITVDPSKPAVEAIRLRAQKAGVTLSKIEVAFEDGSSKSFEKRSTLTVDVFTGDLRFEKAGKVKSITVEHGAANGATLEVQGLI